MRSLQQRLKRIRENLPPEPMEIIVILPDDAPKTGPNQFYKHEAPEPTPGGIHLSIIYEEPLSEPKP